MVVAPNEIKDVAAFPTGGIQMTPLAEAEVPRL